MVEQVKEVKFLRMHIVAPGEYYFEIALNLNKHTEIELTINTLTNQTQYNNKSLRNKNKYAV